MTLAEAARLYQELRPELGRLAKEVGEAEAVLKAHFRHPGARKVYRGIAYALTTYQALDISKAREALGPRAAACQVERTRETLTIVEEE